jgi:hypothetical protein
MRCDQFIGLPPAAKHYLRATGLEGVLPSVVDTYSGMFEEVYPLYRYELKDDRYAIEFVQADPWASGPCFFLGLRVYGPSGDVADIFCWDEEEIDNLI